MNNKKMLIILLVLIFFNYQPAFAYIDPGTGSMLFSIIVGATATIFFVLNSIFIKIKSILFTSKKLSKISAPFVIYSEGKQYWCVFKPVVDEFEKRKIPLIFYTSAKDDFIFDENYKYVKAEFIGKGNSAYFKLAFLNADICLMTTPQLDVLQLKRSKNVKHYSHIFHSIGFSCDYHLYGLDYYDSVLCDADFQIPLIRKIERKRDLPQKELIVVGSTYMDYYEECRKNLKTEEKKEITVLIAPSWGQFNLLYEAGETLLDKLSKTEYKIIIRPHPQSMIVEKPFINKLMKRYEKCEKILWNFDPNNIKVLAETDILISDFSCIMFDYAFLFNKPFIYINTDFNYETTDVADLSEIPWKYNISNIIGREINSKQIKEIDIEELISNTINNTDLFNEIQKAKNYAWKNQGQAAKLVVDFLVKKQKELDKK